MSQPGPPYLVGWKEYVRFPEWGIGSVKAKMDTGARTSVVHVVAYRIQDDGNGGKSAELRLALRRKHPDEIKVIQVPVERMIEVTDSGGHQEWRPLVRTTLRLGPVTKPVLLTVTNRGGMLFRVLIGRKALEGDFVVDVSRKYLMRRRR